MTEKRNRGTLSLLFNFQSSFLMLWPPQGESAAARFRIGGHLGKLVNLNFNHSLVATRE